MAAPPPPPPKLALKKAPGLPLSGKKVVVAATSSPATSPRKGLVGGLSTGTASPATSPRKGLVGSKVIPSGVPSLSPKKAPSASGPSPPSAPTPKKSLTLKKVPGPDAGGAPPLQGNAPPAPPAKKTVAAPVAAATKTPVKTAVKAPVKLPLKIPVGKTAVVSPGVSPRLAGGREQPSDSPIPTPRDMPVPGDSAGLSDSESPRASYVPPPPEGTPPETPRSGADLASSAVPSIIATPRIPLDEIIAPTSAVSPKAATTDVPPDSKTPTNPPSPTAAPAPVDGAVISAFSLDSTAQQGGQAVHGSTGAAKRLDESSEQLVEELREKVGRYQNEIQQLERQVREGDRRAESLEKDATRLREALCDREGAKVVHHITELERENRRLCIALQREKEAVMAHQNAQMAAVDELMKLKMTISVKGDYIQLKEEHERLSERVSELVRANTDLSLKLAEVSEANALMSCAPDDLRTSQQQFIRVRRGALCHVCSDMVDRWEAAVQRRELGRSGFRSQSPIYADPVSTMSFVSSAKAASAALVAKGWRVLQLDNGNVVYHNAITNQSQWDMPSELRQAMEEQQRRPKETVTPSKPPGTNLFADVLGSPTAITPDTSHNYRGGTQQPDAGAPTQNTDATASPYTVAPALPPFSLVGAMTPTQAKVGGYTIGTSLFSSPAARRR